MKKQIITDKDFINQIDEFKEKYHRKQQQKEAIIGFFQIVALLVAIGMIVLIIKSVF